MWILLLLTVLAVVTEPQQSQPEVGLAEEAPLRLGGDPSASDWWSGRQRVRWEADVDFERAFAEREPSSCFMLSVWDVVPERPPGGEDRVRAALRSAFLRSAGVPSPALVAAMMEIRELTHGEIETLLRGDDVVVASAVLRGAAKEQDHRWLTRARLGQIAADGEAPELRLAALMGLARHLKLVDYRADVDSTLGRLLDLVRDSGESEMFRSTAATIASLQFFDGRTRGTAELWQAELLEALRGGLDPSRMGQAAGWERACAEAVIRISADSSTLGFAIQRQAIRSLFAGRMAAAQEADAFGEALVFYATICAHGCARKDAASEVEAHALGVRLVATLATCSVDEGAWLTLALAQLILGQVTSNEMPEDWLPAYARQLEKAERSGHLDPYIPSYVAAPLSRWMPLKSWALAAPSPEERGRRLFCIAQTGAYDPGDWKLYVDESTEHNASFWRHAAPVIATHCQRGHVRQAVPEALVYGRGHGWSIVEQLPLIDALGMSTSDAAVGALIEVIQEESPGTRLHDQAALSLGRIFEVYRANIMVHPLRSELYPHPVH